jgi:TPR repeat protein
VFGNFVSPSKPSFNSSFFIQGKREYLSGIAHFEDRYDELGLARAFEYFTKSAKLGFPEGQIRLAEMYLSGVETKQDLNLTLFWLEQAALQSNKRAILKYGIVCQQVKSCNIVDFYQTLIESGVNLKVRNVDVKLSSPSLK